MLPEPPVLAHVGAVVGGEHYVGVVQLPPPLEEIKHGTYRIVDLSDRAKLVAPPLLEPVSLAIPYPAEVTHPLGLVRGIGLVEGWLGVQGGFGVHTIVSVGVVARLQVGLSRPEEQGERVVGGLVGPSGPASERRPWRTNSSNRWACRRRRSRSCTCRRGP